MQHTITLIEIIEHGDFTIRFADKQFATTTLNELLAFSELELEAISGKLLRSLLIIEYMKQQRLPISATLNSDAPSGQIVTING